MEKNIDFGYVADIYDYYANVDFDIDFFKKLCRGRKNILELMCGTGRVSIPLINEGFSITCVDYSEEMLEIFRKKIGGSQSVSKNGLKSEPQKGQETHEGREPQNGLQNISPNIKLVCQDVCELNLEERFDLVIIPSNSISEIIDKEKRRQALRCIHKHLTPDGIFFCTLYNPEYRIRLADGHIRYLGKYELEGGRTLVVTYYNVYSPERSIISGAQFYEIYDGSRMTEKRRLDIQFSVITEEEICKMAGEEGFSLKAAYGDYAPYHYDKASKFMNLLFTKKRRRK